MPFLKFSTPSVQFVLIKYGQLPPDGEGVLREPIVEVCRRPWHFLHLCQCQLQCWLAVLRQRFLPYMPKTQILPQDADFIGIKQIQRMHHQHSGFSPWAVCHQVGCGEIDRKRYRCWIPFERIQSEGKRNYNGTLHQEKWKISIR